MVIFVTLERSKSSKSNTFHYSTLKKRCSPYITLATTVGCDGEGINLDKINLIVNYKMNNSNQVVEELLKNSRIEFIYDDIDRIKSLILLMSKTIYSCIFNFKTIKSRIYLIRGDKEILDEDVYGDDD